MPWPEMDAMTAKVEFIFDVLGGVGRISPLCRLYGISRKTAYKWLNRYRASGLDGLKELSRARRSQPRRVARELEEAICGLRKERPTWGSRKIRARLKLDGWAVPSIRTVENVLKRHGLNGWSRPDPPARRRFEAEAPNDLWQMDIKGWFTIKGQGRVYPITLVDDHSRYLLALKAFCRETGANVQETLMEALKHYGCPGAILTDNGPQFRHPTGWGLTRLGVWLAKLGIRHIHTGKRRPTTLGKLERLHETLTKDLIRRRRFLDLRDCQRAFDQFRQDYNQIRPHQGIGDLPPASRYRPSERRLDQVLVPVHYQPGTLVRKVNGAGIISLGGTSYIISQSLAGERVRLEQVAPNLIRVWFLNQLVKELPLKEGP